MKRDLRPRHDVLNIPTNDDLCYLYVSTQARASRILTHGAADRSELDELARMCDVPTHVLCHQLGDAHDDAPRLEMAEVA